MNAKRPAPLYDGDEEPRPVCPVCGHPSYSRTGIHPQCSLRKADEQRMVVVKANRQSEKPKRAAASGQNRPWHKPCPKCRTEVHVRRANCDCGHKFVNRAPVR